MNENAANQTFQMGKSLIAGNSLKTPPELLE